MNKNVVRYASCWLKTHNGASSQVAVAPGMALAAVRRRLLGKQPLLCRVEGDSSGDEADAEAESKSRCQCGQFVWPCPRENPQELATRKARKWLKPEDLSKEAFGLLFKDVGTRLGLGPKFEKLHVFDEPHKKFSTAAGVRERHKHLVFKVKCGFAHVRFQKDLAARGVYGHFSFNLVGYVSYLRYCLTESPKKLLSDTDQTPWSWPPIAPAALIALCEKPTPQMDARNNDGAAAKGRKRKLMTFSEVTDAFVEAGVQTEQDAWILAKSRKVAGDDTLFNTLGAAPCVSNLVTRVVKAWGCETMACGTLCKQPDYTLDKFIPPHDVSPQLDGWLAGGWKRQVLILCGEPGIGKTELGRALLHSVAGSFHFVNKLDRLRDVVFCPGQGLVVDELCLAGKDVDDVKALLDLAKTRDMECRNRDGVIPRGTPRVFSTNWPWDLFWPRAVMGKEHKGAILRRVL